MSNGLIVDDERLGLPSASGMDKLFACPGSRNLEAVCPEDGSSQWAERGTNIHTANETGDVSALADDDAEIVESARRAEDRIIDEWAQENDIVACEAVSREQREWITRGVEPIASAKLDFSLIGTDRTGRQRGIILDLKSGRLEVAPPASNQQLRTCAIALWQNNDLFSVTVGIVQPLVKKQDVCSYGVADLSKAFALMVSAIAAANKPDAPRIPGKHCQFCRGRFTCPERQAEAQALETVSRLAWSAVPAEEKPKLWERAKAVAKFATELQKKIEGEVDAGLVPGLIRKPDSQVRAIGDVMQAYEVLSEHLKADGFQSKFMAAVSLGIGDTQKLIQELGNKTKKDADAFINEHLAGCIVSTPKRGSVVAVKEVA